MWRVAKTVVQTTAVVVCLAVGAATTLAQVRGGPPMGGGPGVGPGGGMGGPPFPGGGIGVGGIGVGSLPQAGQSQPRIQGNDGSRSGLQLGPVGRWWDDHSVVKSLKLRPEQTARMDAIFEQNRGSLMQHFQGLQQAELLLDALARSPVPDEVALDTQIDRVAQARAELEKVNTHMLLQIRREMEPEQIKRLEERR